MVGSKVGLMKPISIGDTLMFAYDIVAQEINTVYHKVHKTGIISKWVEDNGCIVIETEDGTSYVFMEV